MRRHPGEAQNNRNGEAMHAAAITQWGAVARDMHEDATMFTAGVIDAAMGTQCSRALGFVVDTVEPFIAGDQVFLGSARVDLTFFRDLLHHPVKELCLLPRNAAFIMVANAVELDV